MAGRTFAAWVLAAHRASQERDFAARLAGGTGFALTPAELRAFGAVAPGLPDRAGKDAAFAVGILDDGAGVGMAFGVLETRPRPGRSRPCAKARSTPVSRRSPKRATRRRRWRSASRPSKRALGRPVAADALYGHGRTAGIRYRDDTLYRRPQPGRPWLNRMETGLDAGGRDPRRRGRRDGAVGKPSPATRRRAARPWTRTWTPRASMPGPWRPANSTRPASPSPPICWSGAPGSRGAVRTRSAAVSGRLEAAALRASGRLTAGTLAAARDRDDHRRVVGPLA